MIAFRKIVPQPGVLWEELAGGKEKKRKKNSPSPQVASCWNKPWLKRAIEIRRNIFKKN